MKIGKPIYIIAERPGREDDEFSQFGPEQKNSGLIFGGSLEPDAGLFAESVGTGAQRNLMSGCQP